jgi:hypothetical protein
VVSAEVNTSIDRRISGAEYVRRAPGPFEAVPPPVAAHGFASARASWSPFGVPSYFSIVARANHVVGSYPAIDAIRAISAGGHGLAPVSQLYTAPGCTCSACASLYRVPTIAAASLISFFKSIVFPSGIYSLAICCVL